MRSQHLAELRTQRTGVSGIRQNKVSLLTGVLLKVVEFRTRCLNVFQRTNAHAAKGGPSKGIVRVESLAIDGRGRGGN